METVEDVLRELNASWQEHKMEHPDCPVMQDDAFPLTDGQRAEFLGLIATSAKDGLISPEDEMQLEIAVGTYGEPEKFGWPDTTTNLEKVAVIGILGRLLVSAHGGPGGMALEALAEAIKEAREGGSTIPEEGVSFRHGDSEVHLIPVPPQLANLLGQKQPPSDPEEDAADWFRRGYL